MTDQTRKPNFAVPFKLDFPYKDQVDEFNIIYKKSKISSLIDFLNQYGIQKKVNILLEKSEDMEKKLEDIKVICLSEKQYNISVVLESTEEKSVDFLTENQIPFYFSIVATEWDVLRQLVDRGASQVIVGQDLGFDLINVFAFALQNDIKVRAYVNVSQTKWSNAPGLKTFFIRPEDVSFYAQVIDTFEFWQDGKRYLKPIYQAYARKERWYGPLKEIISGYNGDQDSRYILPQFPYRRIKCGRSCVKETNPRCRVCDQMIDLSELLQKQNTVIRLEKKKN